MTFRELRDNSHRKLCSAVIVRIAQIRIPVVQKLRIKIDGERLEMLSDRRNATSATLRWFFTTRTGEVKFAAPYGDLKILYEHPPRRNARGECEALGWSCATRLRCIWFSPLMLTAGYCSLPFLSIHHQFAVCGSHFSWGNTSGMPD